MAFSPSLHLVTGVFNHTVRCLDAGRLREGGREVTPCHAFAEADYRASQPVEQPLSSMGGQGEGKEEPKEIQLLPETDED